MTGSGEQVREWQYVIINISRASLGIPVDPGSNPGRAIIGFDGCRIENPRVVFSSDPGRAIPKTFYILTVLL